MPDQDEPPRHPVNGFAGVDGQILKVIGHEQKRNGYKSKNPGAGESVPAKNRTAANGCLTLVHGEFAVAVP